MSSQRGATAPRTMPCSPLSPSDPCLENPGKWGGLSSLGHQSVFQVQEALLGSRLLPVFGDLPTPCCPAVPLLPSPGPVHLPGDTLPTLLCCKPFRPPFPGLRPRSQASHGGDRGPRNKGLTRSGRSDPIPPPVPTLPNTAPCHAPLHPQDPPSAEEGREHALLRASWCSVGPSLRPPPD